LWKTSWREDFCKENKLKSQVYFLSLAGLSTDRAVIVFYFIASS
jgi:hypothetical protein